MPESSVTSRAWKKGEVVEENFPFAKVSDFIDAGDMVVWADLDGTAKEHIHALAEELDLDHNAIEDALAENERPKVYHYDKFKFITAYSVTVDVDAATLSTDRVSVFMTPRALITIRPGGGFDMAPIIERWDDTNDLIAQGVGGLLHGLLDVIVDGHFDAVQKLDDAIEGIEDTLFAERPQDQAVQRRSYDLRKALVQLRRVVLPMRELVGTLARTIQEDHPQLRPYYDDLYDHVLRVMEWTESLRDMISTIFETNLSLADARLNTIMKKLTAWAAIIAVPTAITGFYGQNVPYPGFSHAVGFWTSTILIVVIVTGLYVVFRRRGWL